MAMPWATNLLHFHLNKLFKKIVSNLALFCLETYLVTFQKIGQFFENHLVTLNKFLSHKYHCTYNLRKCWTRQKNVGMDKHSSLFVVSVSDEEKSFVKLTPHQRKAFPLVRSRLIDLEFN